MVIAALTAILVKLGVEDIKSDLAALIRTAVVPMSIFVLVGATGKFESLG